MRARIRETEIYFDIEGAALVPDGSRMREKPIAFLVHGGPGGDHTASKVGGSGLSERLQVVYFDQRGHGRSAQSSPEMLNLDENVEDLEALRQYLGAGPIVCIGTSYGGMVAMAHAARYPHAISHLVLVSTAAHAGFIARAGQIVRERGTEEQISAWADLLSGRLDDAAKMRHYLEVMGSLYSTKFDLQLSRQRLARGIQAPMALNRAFAPGGFLRTFDLRGELRSIAAPTLILAGRHDWICAPEFSEEIHGLIAGSDLRVFEGSSHHIRADEPQQFLDAIAGFLVYRPRRESSIHA